MLAHHRPRTALREAEVDADLDTALEAEAVRQAFVSDSSQMLRLVAEDCDGSRRARERLHPLLERELVERVADVGCEVRLVVSHVICAGWPAIRLASRENVASAFTWFADETASQPLGRTAKYRITATTANAPSASAT